MRLSALFLSLAACACGASPERLFNGRDLSGWQHEGPRPAFAVRNGELATSGVGNAPNWIHTTREFENLQLSFEYKLAQWTEAAVIVRAPRLGRPAQSGIALVLAHDFHKVVDAYVTGAIAGARPPARITGVLGGLAQSPAQTGPHAVARGDRRDSGARSRSGI